MNRICDLMELFINRLFDSVKFFTSSLEDENGGASTTRVALHFVLVMIVGTWSITCLRKNTLISFGATDTILPALFAGLKYVQKKDEVKEAIEIEKLNAKKNGAQSS